MTSTAPHQLDPAARVAVVDDDPDILRLLRVTLGVAGLHVTPFSGGEELLLALERESFDLVISDVEMPGLDGVQLMEILRRRDSRLPLMLLSVRGREEDLLRGLEAGASDYLIKPASPAVIRAKARHLLRETLPKPGHTIPREPELPCSLGSYVLQEELGRGGYGVVYRAEGPEGGAVALKLLYPEVSQDTELLTRYLREVDTLRALKAPHVVPYLDCGVAGGRHFLVMKLLSGQTALKRLVLEGPFPLSRALDVGAQLAEAVEVLHNASLVHRDLKPSNVVLAEDGEATLIDFGLAKAAGDQSLTETRDLLGSPSFLAPELIRGERPAWVGSDLYALGATLYQLVSGRRPHATTGDDDYATLKAAAAATEPPTLTGVNPILGRVVRLLMHPDPQRRLVDPAAARTQLDLARRAASNMERRT